MKTMNWAVRLYNGKMLFTIQLVFSFTNQQNKAIQDDPQAMQIKTMWQTITVKLQMLRYIANAILWFKENKGIIHCRYVYRHYTDWDTYYNLVRP